VVIITDLELLKFKILNNKYPFYSDSELEEFLEVHETVEKAAYAICRNLASITDVTFGSNSVVSMSKFWLSKAVEFRTPSHGRIARADEI